MKQWQYNSYEEYVKAQIDGIYKHPEVKDNYNYEWANKKEIQFIVDEIINPYFHALNINPTRGVCHGAKLGKENMWFSEASEIDWIGTDIVIETNEKMNLYNWDFNKENKEWENTFDVIYSNSFDHAYDARQTLKNWGLSLKDDGIIKLEHSRNDIQITKTDPFGATLEEYKTLIQELNFELIDVFNFSSVKNRTNFELSYLTFKKNKLH